MTVRLDLSDDEAFALFEWLTLCGPLDAGNKEYAEKFRPVVYAIAHRLETPVFKARRKSS